MELQVYILFGIVVSGTWAAFNPTLSVDSCTKSSLALTATNAEDNGIIYIQGQGAACKQTTTSNVSTHTFDFSACGIAWESSFKVIVQKKALYQTGEDKQIPVLCVADTADLTLTNSLLAADKDDDAGQNLTVKPTATMSLYKDGIDIAGGTVKLTDIVTMILQLDNEYIQDFDLRAKDCTASTIPITTGSCAVDAELFPQFTHTSQGILTASFGAFRTTDLNGGSVAMTFSCTMKVCLGACSAVTCGDGSSGWGRKKRSLVKRQAADDADAPSGFDDISVGSTIEISAEEVVLTAPEDVAEMCVDRGGFIVGMVAMATAMVACIVTSGFMFKKLQEKTEILKKLNPGNQMTPISIPVA